MNSDDSISGADSDGRGTSNGKFFRSLKDPSLGDIVALLAIAISIGSATWNAAIGARVTMLAPQEVVFRCNTYDTDSSKCSDDVLGVGAQTLTYVNTGAPSYGAVVIDEWVELELPRKMVKLNWKYFSNIVVGQPSTSKPAGPVFVAGRQAVTHETQFRPRELHEGERRRNFYSWSDFVNEVKDRELTELELVFGAATILGKRRQREISASCRITIGDERSKGFICTEESCVRYAVFTCVSR